MFYGPMSSMSFDSGAHRTASNAQSDARRANAKVEALGRDIERLFMITEALWTILKEDHGFNDAELMLRVTEIDMRDGKLDGKAASTAPGPCPKCQRPLSKKRSFCLYCGELTVANPFAH